MDAGYLGAMLFIVLFISVGVIMTVIAIVRIMKYNKCKDVWNTVEAEITNIRVSYSGGKTHHSPEITYTHNRQQHTKSLGYYSSSMRVGQVLTIIVNPENSNEIMYKNGYTFLLIYGLAWTIFSSCFFFF